MPNQKPAETILEVNQLSHYFDGRGGTVKAVDDISFELRAGETLGIVGESGSGKSVTALSIMRLLSIPPRLRHIGEILFQSYILGRSDLRKLPDDVIRLIRGDEIGIIFQEPRAAMNPVFTCGNHAIETILAHQKIEYDEARSKILELFERVRLDNPTQKYDAYPHQLSGGELQRVMIAIAIACEPRILIADEPTTALDVTTEAHVINWLREYKASHDLSMIFISHDLNLMAEVADRILLMRDGKIVEQGTVDELFSNPRFPYTQSLLACRPRPELDQKYLPEFKDFANKEQVDIKAELKAGLRPAGERAKRRKRLETSPVLVEARSISVWYPIKRGLLRKTVDHKKAVQSVSLIIREGETLGIVGASGSGKTTLSRVLARLQEHTYGELYYKGEEISQLAGRRLRDLRKEIQIIFQDATSALNPQMTVANIINEPLQVHQLQKTAVERRYRVEELARQVGLEHKLLDRLPSELSGGQRQRVSIARALALEPRFLICDESVSALDVGVQAQILNLLNKLKEEYNFTLVFISHDLSVVKFIADRVIVMQEGQLIEEGYANELYENPSHPYTRQLIDAIPKGISKYDR